MSLRIEEALLYPGSGGSVVQDAVVIARDGRIAYAGPKESAPSPTPGERVVRAGGALCMPAFYNAHTHLAMTLLRGAGTDLPLREWLFDAIFPLEERLTPECIAAGTRLALMESLRCGVVGVADMYFEMDAVAHAVLESGMRASLCRGMNGTDLAAFAGKIADNEAFYHEFHGAEGRITVPVGLHAEYTTMPAMLELGAKSAHKLGAGIHIHASETRAEHEECLARHGMTPVALFERHGLLDAPQPALLAHGVAMAPEDLEITSQKRAFIAHCPASNLKLGSGVFRASDALARGIRVALGTDGAASNNRLDILSEMRLAALLAKGAGDPTALPAFQAVAMATASAAQACGFPEAGYIKDGALADFILLDMSAPHARPFRDAAGHVAYAASASDIVLTVCGGKILYDHGVYTTLDAEKVLAEFDACWRWLDA